MVSQGCRRHQPHQAHHASLFELCMAELKAQGYLFTMLEFPLFICLDTRLLTVISGMKMRPFSLRGL